MGELSYKVDPSLFPEVTKGSNNYQSSSSDQITNKEQSSVKIQVGSSLNNPIGLYVKLQNKQNLLTLMDLGASDHCITNQTMFITYEALNKPLKGLSADKESSFDIIGKDNAVLYTCVNKGKQKVILENTLYTPSLRSNLISVSTLLEKDTKVYFDGDEAVVKTQDGIEVMSAVKLGKLFVIKMDYPIPETFIAQSNWKAVTFDTWHHRLVHTRADTIREMIKKSLVDSLNTYRDLKMQDQCEDYIYGKHSACLYSKNHFREKDVLKRIYVDIWGPAQTQSAGEAQYFILMMDSFSSFRTVAFLSSKSADVTLKVFKTYQIEAKCQTGKKIKRVWLDIGWEWYNQAWEQYRQNKGLDFEFTIPYAY